jgi:hypothetical protein
MPDARTTADRVMVRLELIADRLDSAVAELRVEVKRLTDLAGRDEGGAVDDRADDREDADEREDGGETDRVG